MIRFTHQSLFFMDLQLLKTFLTLASTQNFTQAAVKLHRSQSAISLQLAKLEEILGKPLLNRDNRNVALTTYGEDLIPFAQKLLSLSDQMLSYFRDSKSLCGEVRLGTPEDVASVYLPAILANFTKTYPQIALNVHCELTKYLIEGFEGGVYDLVLIKQDPKHCHPRSELIWHEHLEWVCHKDYVSTFLDKMPILPLILAPSPCVYRQRALDTLTKENIKWRISVTSPSYAGMMAAVRAGLGVSVMPKKMVPEDLYILNELPALKETQIALLKADSPTPAMRALGEFVAEHILLDVNV